ncbi:MAG: PfkB family carbohydrate kinase [bacterium]|nr:PfkB family carbohydrate kinase [bacterium]
MTNVSTRDRLIRFILDFTAQKVLVVGDLMLDQYSWGDVERISPEAPIPVVKMGREEFRLGGAASVINNLQALGCEPLAVGLLGDDIAGRKFLEIYRESGLDPAGLVVDPVLQTILKVRVLTRQQQMIRLDYESGATHPDSARQALRQRVIAAMDQAQAVVLSDYAKGVLDASLIQTCIAEANQRGLPIVADPGKGVPIEAYRGITSIKPNRTEAEGATGIKITDQDSMLRAAAALQEKVQAQFLTLSLDKDGLLYYRSATDWTLYPTEVREVFDVTGAGDMVVTLLAVALAAGAPPEVAFPLANIGAELEIAHMGVVPLPWSDLLTRVESGMAHSKVTSLSLLLKERQKDELPMVFANGYFDQISAGHLRFLLEAGKTPGRLVVAINSDQGILRQKGAKPLLGEMDRARLLASIENVYRVIVFDQEDASALIRQLRPQTVVKGAEFKDAQLPTAEAEAIAEVGAQVEYLPHFDYETRRT